MHPALQNYLWPRKNATHSVLWHPPAANAHCLELPSLVLSPCIPLRVSFFFTELRLFHHLLWIPTLILLVPSDQAPLGKPIASKPLSTPKVLHTLGMSTCGVQTPSSAVQPKRTGEGGCGSGQLLTSPKLALGLNLISTQCRHMPLSSARWWTARYLGLTPQIWSTRSPASWPRIGLQHRGQPPPLLPVETKIRAADGGGRPRSLGSFVFRL